MCGKHVRISAEAQGRRLRRQWNHSFAGTVEKRGTQEQWKDRTRQKTSGNAEPDRRTVETQDQTEEP